MELKNIKAVMLDELLKLTEIKNLPAFAEEAYHVMMHYKILLTQLETE